MGTINFEGKVYPVRTVTFTDKDGTLYEDVTVSTESLERVLVKDGAYASEGARRIDEDIIFYLPSEDMTKSDEELCKIMEEVFV